MKKQAMATRKDLMRQLQTGKMLHINGILEKVSLLDPDIRFSLRAKVTSEPFPARHAMAHWSVHVTFENVDIVGNPPSAKMQHLTIPNAGDHGFVSVYFLEQNRSNFTFTAREDLEMARRAGTCGQAWLEGTSYLCSVKFIFVFEAYIISPMIMF